MAPTPVRNPRPRSSRTTSPVAPSPPCTSTTTCRTNFYAYTSLNQLRKKDCPEGVLTYDYDGGGNLTNLQAFQHLAPGDQAP